MEMTDDPGDFRSFQTLRGFLAGEEPDEEIYFAYSATLRVFGLNLPFDEISSRLGVLPTNFRRKGERRGPRSPEYKEDAWMYQAPLDESEPLDHHIDALWKVVYPEIEYVRSLKTRYRVDVFCGYRSNCDMAGFEIPHQSLRLFTDLEIPFGVSVMLG